MGGAVETRRDVERNRVVAEVESAERIRSVGGGRNIRHDRAGGIEQRHRDAGKPRFGIGAGAVFVLVGEHDSGNGGEGGERIGYRETEPLSVPSRKRTDPVKVDPLDPFPAVLRPYFRPERDAFMAVIGPSIAQQDLLRKRNLAEKREAAAAGGFGIMRRNRGFLNRPDNSRGVVRHRNMPELLPSVCVGKFDGFPELAVRENRNRDR